MRKTIATGVAVGMLALLVLASGLAAAADGSTESLSLLDVLYGVADAFGGIADFIGSFADFLSMEESTA